MTGTRLGQVPIVASWMQYGVDLHGTGTHVKPVQRSNWGLGGLSALAGRTDLYPVPKFSYEDAEGFEVDPGTVVHMAIVANESRRPIKNVVCKAASPHDTDHLLSPDPYYPAVMVGRLANQRLGPGREPPSLIDEIPNFRTFRIRPGEAYGFVFAISIHWQLMDSEAARFTDDAGLHWQIDYDLHLEPLNDRNDW